MNAEEIDDEDYSAEEFYEDFIKDSGEEKKPKSITQRVGKKELIALVAKQCRYPKHEVEDVLKGLWDVININLEKGREFDIGGMFVARLYKPHSRRLFDWKNGGFRMTDPRPKLKLVPTDMYQKYLWRGIHCPVNYFPPEKTRHQDSSREEFTKILNDATIKWQEEDQRRQAKKLKENQNANETST